MAHYYLIRYISGRTLSACFDSEPAANIIAAYNAFKSRRPDARSVDIKNRQGTEWVSFGREIPDGDPNSPLYDGIFGYEKSTFLRRQYK